VIFSQLIVSCSSTRRSYIVCSVSPRSFIPELCTACDRFITWHYLSSEFKAASQQRSQQSRFSILGSSSVSFTVHAPGLVRKTSDLSKRHEKRSVWRSKEGVILEQNSVVRRLRFHGCRAASNYLKCSVVFERRECCALRKVNSILPKDSA